jgi:hypothetical protein
MLVLEGVAEWMDLIVRLMMVLLRRLEDWASPYLVEKQRFACQLSSLGPSGAKPYMPR